MSKWSCCRSAKVGAAKHRLRRLLTAKSWNCSIFYSSARPDNPSQVFNKTKYDLRAWSTRIETHQALPTFELVNVKVRRVIVFRHCNFFPNSSPVCSGSVMIYRVVCTVDSDFSCWQTSWRTKVLQEVPTALSRLKSKLRIAAPLKQASRQNC